MKSVFFGLLASLSLSLPALAVSNGDTILIKISEGQYKSCNVTKLSSEGAIQLYCGGTNISTTVNALTILTKKSDDGDVRAESDIILRDAPSQYNTYYVSAIYSDGVIELYSRSSGRTSFKSASDVHQLQVTTLTSIPVTMQYLDRSKSTEIHAERDLITRLAQETYQTQYVSTIYSDGVVVLYNRTTSKTSYLTKEEVSARLVETMTSIGNIRAESDIVERDADKTYVTYYVSSIYSDGVLVLYNRSTSRTIFRTMRATADSGVTTVSSVALTIQTMNGEKPITVKTESDIILRMAQASYQTHYVSTIYSDGVLAIYNRSTSQTSYITKDDLAGKIVESWREAGKIKTETDIIERDATKTYVTYYVSTIYSDGIAVLYRRSNSQTIYRSMSDTTKADVSTLSTISVPIDTPAGPNTSLVRSESDLILRLNPGNYQTHYVSTIYSDSVLSLYNRASGGTTVWTKDEIAPMLVEKLAKVEKLSSDSAIALPSGNADHPLERSDFYLSALYTDGIAALYSYESNKTSFSLSVELSDRAIKIVDSLDMLAKNGIYRVTDTDGKQSSIYVQSLYQDRVLRFIPIVNKKDITDDGKDIKKSQFAHIEDFKQIEKMCDPAKTRGSCRSWWEKKDSGKADKSEDPIVLPGQQPTQQPTAGPKQGRRGD